MGTALPQRRGRSRLNAAGPGSSPAPTCGDGRLALHYVATPAVEAAVPWFADPNEEHMPRIYVSSVFVDDQEKALSFYTEVLGFTKKTDVPAGEARWLTVVSPEDPDGVELLLEPDGHPAVRPFKSALQEDGIPFASFMVADVRAEHERLSGLGVRFTQGPADMGPVTTAVLDDTCGNLVQLVTLHS